MTKPQKGFAVITAIVLLIATTALVKPVTDWVHNKIKYRDFDRYLDIGITAYYENDYAAAYDAYMSAYDSLAAENDFDRDMKAGACQIAAECLGMTGDLYGVIDTLERGYAGRVTYGMLTASFLSTLAGVYLPGKWCLIQRVETDFPKPVYPGDTLTVTGTVKEKDETFRHITLAVRIRNQAGDTVLRGKMRLGVLR